MSDQVVLVEKSNGVATVSLNRPDKRNAINGEMIDALGTVFSDLAFDRETKAVVLTGTGPIFSSGIDVTWIGSLGAEGPEHIPGLVRVMARRIQSVMNTVENLEKPVIALLRGPVVGLGLELSMACDFRVSPKSSRFGVPEILLGMVPDCGGTTRLTRALGVARAKELIMLGDMIPAEKAYNWGLVNEIYEDDQFDQGAKAFIEKVLDRPSPAIGLTKRLIDMGASTDRMTFMDIEATIQALCMSDPKFPETMMMGFPKVKAEVKK